MINKGRIYSYYKFLIISTIFLALCTYFNNSLFFYHGLIFEIQVYK